MCILQVTFFSNHINNTFYSVGVPFIISPPLNSTRIPAFLLGASRRFQLFIQRLNNFWNQVKSIINKVMRNLLLVTFVSSLFRIEGRRKIAPSDSQRTGVTRSYKSPRPGPTALRTMPSGRRWSPNWKTWAGRAKFPTRNPKLPSFSWCSKLSTWQRPTAKPLQLVLGRVASSSGNVLPLPAHLRTPRSTLLGTSLGWTHRDFC